jgi:hypothetical protein
MGGTDAFIGYFNTLMAKIRTAMDAGLSQLIEHIFWLNPIGGNYGGIFFDHDHFADDIGERLHGGVVHDAQVEPEIGVAHIEGVPLESPEDLVKGLGGAAIAFDLGETCDTGLHDAAKFVSIQYTGEVGAILIHMGAGSDDAHMPRQDIQELGKLVQVTIAKKTAHPGDPGVVVGGLFGIRFGIDAHRPEFEAGEGTSKEAYPGLYEEDRSFRVKFYEKIEDGEKPAKDEKEHAQ